MHVDSEFTVGIHILACYGILADSGITSKELGLSIGCNAVIVRKVMAKLNKAGLLKTGMGRAQTALGRPAESITLKDVLLATEEESASDVFSMYPAVAKCPLSRDMRRVLAPHFQSAFDAMLEDLSHVTMADIISEFPKDKNAYPIYVLKQQELGGRERQSAVLQS
ncbi:MAG: Rrf2 family transcriptional regulator [Thermoplasmata archaeon]|nr:Rrf2 family transcriptional regulator [Thermoplasmata archaeon]